MIVAIYGTGDGAWVAVKTSNNKLLWEGKVSVVMIKGALAQIKGGAVIFQHARKVVIETAELSELLPFAETEEEKEALARAFKEGARKEVVWVC